MNWLDAEVFVQSDDKGKAIGEEQLAFEDELDRDIEEASAAAQHSRQVAAGLSQLSDN